jgi:hypothetical protein
MISHILVYNQGAKIVRQDEAISLVSLCALNNITSSETGQPSDGK